MSGNREVQCFDGDGTVPPEITKLMAELESLKAMVREMTESRRRDEATINALREELEEFHDKFGDIVKIIRREKKAPPWKGDYDNNMSPRYDECIQAEDLSKEYREQYEHEQLMRMMKDRGNA